MLTALSVKGVTAPGGEAVEMVGNTDIAAAAAQDATGTQSVTVSNAAPVTDRAESIAVKATVSGGASYRVMRGLGAPAKTYTPSTLTGATVPLLATPTPAAGGPDAPGTNTDNAITVMVTGENGYNDHAYTFTAQRANPAGNLLEQGEIFVNGTALSGTGDGTNASPWVITTASAAAGSATVIFNLIALGTGSTSGYCVQSVKVFRVDGSEHPKATDTDADLCPGESYSLSAGGTSTNPGDGRRYRVEMRSEAKKPADFYILVQRGA